MPIRGKGYPGRLTSGPSSVPHPALSTGGNYTLNVRPKSIIPLSAASVSASQGVHSGVQRQTPTQPLKRQGFT